MKTPKLHSPGRQMSDAFVTMIFLTLSGGFQDAYTYLMRGRVFANAQTGNIVLLGERLFHADGSGALRYLVPICAFALGVFTAERVRRTARNRRGIHWRQWIVLAEVAILGAVGLMPVSLNLLANAMVSFSCALQVQAFRKFNGRAYASTMCIGNLRSGMEAMEAYLYTREKPILRTALEYFSVVALFALGAGAGGAISPRLGLGAIWLCCAGLSVSFLLMFLNPEEPGKG